MHRKPGRNLIIDVGSATGEFTDLLRRRNPECDVLGIDKGDYPRADVRDYFGAFFRHQLKEPERLKCVWLNHVDVYSMHEGFPQLRAMVKKIPPGTPVILTVRRSHIDYVKDALTRAGLEVKKSVPWSTRMTGSTYTQKYYREAQAGLEKQRPFRIVAIKPKA